MEDDEFNDFEEAPTTEPPPKPEEAKVPLFEIPDSRTDQLFGADLNIDLSSNNFQNQISESQNDIFSLE